MGMPMWVRKASLRLLKHLGLDLILRMDNMRWEPVTGLWVRPKRAKRGEGKESRKLITELAVPAMKRLAASMVDWKLVGTLQMVQAPRT